MGSSFICTKENYGRIVNLAANIGCMLLNCGSPVNLAERAVTSVCVSLGARKASVFCVPNALAFSAVFEEGEYISLKRAYYGGNDLFKQEKCCYLVREIISGNITLEGAERKFKQICVMQGAAVKAQAFGSMLACASFAIFFGGNMADGLVAAISGLITSGISAVLSRRGTGGCARVFALSAVSGAVAVFLCTLFQLIGIGCHTSVALVGTLMTLIPGLAVCNALSDIVSGEIFSGAYRIFCGLAQTLCIVAGYALALTASGGITAFTVASPRPDLIHILICYISGASGAMGFCLTMNVRGKRLIYGVISAVVSYTAYILCNISGSSSFCCYFVAAATSYAAAQLPSRLLKIPSNVFVTPAVIPLLPGASLYFAVNALVCGDTGTALACGGDALAIFTAIAAGLAAAELAARIILPKSTICFNIENIKRK